jgi:hypothetical protein
MRSFRPWGFSFNALRQNNLSRIKRPSRHWNHIHLETTREVNPYAFILFARSECESLLTDVLVIVSQLGYYGKGDLEILRRCFPGYTFNSSYLQLVFFKEPNESCIRDQASEWMRRAKRRASVRHQRDLRSQKPTNYTQKKY